jgi:hypothetical protein
VGRITKSFRTVFKEELRALREFQRALRDRGRRDAFNDLVKAWSNEMGAMTYVKLPVAFDVMLLTAVVDNRTCILKLADRIEQASSRLEKIQALLDRMPDEH